MPGKLLIIEPKAGVVANVTSDGGTGAANLLTPDPKEVMTANSGTARFLVIDYGEAVTVDSFYVGYTNATNHQFAPFSMTSLAGAGAVQLKASELIRAADCATVRSSKLIRLAAPVASRYFGFYIGVGSIPIQVGVVAAGLAFEASWDREWGSGRRLVDTSKVTQLLSGGFGRQRGARKAAYSWTFGDLTDAETETLWAMQLRLGISDPLVVAEREGATVGANEQLHYGLFTRMDAFERREVQATKWSLEIEEWI